MINVEKFLPHFFIKNDSLFNILSILSLAMLIDYITGMLAAKREGIEHPDNPNYGWNSKKSIRGIYKKVGYIVIDLVSIITDYLIYTISKQLELSFNHKTIFGILVSLWLIINELISILENSARMGAQLPKFLQKVLAELKKDVEDM